MLNKAAISKEQAEAAIEKLGRGKYLSAKVPFSYDYYDKDNDATDDVSGHRHARLRHRSRLRPVG